MHNSFWFENLLLKVNLLMATLVTGGHDLLRLSFILYYMKFSDGNGFWLKRYARVAFSKYFTQRFEPKKKLHSKKIEISLQKFPQKIAPLHEKHISLKCGLSKNSEIRNTSDNSIIEIVLWYTFCRPWRCKWLCRHTQEIADWIQKLN